MKKTKEEHFATVTSMNAAYEALQLHLSAEMQRMTSEMES